MMSQMKCLNRERERGETGEREVEREGGRGRREGGERHTHSHTHSKKIKLKQMVKQMIIHSTTYDTQGLQPIHHSSAA